MIIVCEIRVANDEIITVRVPQVHLVKHLANSVAYSRRGIAEVGFTPEELRLRSPTAWPFRAYELSFTAPFAPDSFEPKLAVGALMHILFDVWQSIRPGILGRLLWLFIDRMECDLWLPGYERLPTATREQFNELIQQHQAWPRIRRFSVNGRVVKSSWY